MKKKKLIELSRLFPHLATLLALALLRTPVDPVVVDRSLFPVRPHANVPERRLAREPHLFHEVLYAPSVRYDLAR